MDILEGPEKGIDVFFFDPGVKKEIKCLVCHTKCDVKRNILGATGFGEAMANHQHRHDRFDCPHSNKKWHQQAIALFEEIRDTSSQSLASIMKKDLENILFENISLESE